MKKATLSLLVITLALICVSCANEVTTKFGEVHIDSYSLEGFTTSSIKHCDYFQEAHFECIACWHEGDSLSFYSVNEDRYVFGKKLPAHEYGRFMKLTASDTNQFVIYFWDAFCVYSAGEFHFLNTDLGQSDIVVKNQTSLVDFPKSKQFAFEIIDYRESPSQEGLFDYSFIGIMDYDGNFDVVPELKYPSIYSQKNLAEPTVYLSSSSEKAFENKLLVSCNYSDDVFVVDVNENRLIETFPVFTTHADFENLPTSSGDREAQIISMHERNQFFESYGKAFFNPRNESLLRFHYPRSRKKDSDGVYVTTFDKKVEIISSYKDSNHYQYKLPFGRYYLSKSWWMDGEGRLVYVKLEIDPKNPDHETRNYSIDYVTTRNF